MLTVQNNFPLSKEIPEWVEKTLSWFVNKVLCNLWFTKWDSCRVSSRWSQTSEARLFGPQGIKKTEKRGSKNLILGHFVSQGGLCLKSNMKNSHVSGIFNSEMCGADMRMWKIGKAAKKIKAFSLKYDMCSRFDVPGEGRNRCLGRKAQFASWILKMEW